MRRTILRCMLVLTVAAGGLAGEARAQNRDAAWEVFPYLGYMKFGASSKIEDFTAAGEAAEIALNGAGSWGLRFGYHFTKQQMIEYAFGGSGTDGTATVKATGGSKSVDFKADVFTAQVGYVYNFFLHHRDKIVGYLSGGTGIFNFSTFGQSSDPDLQLALNNLVGDENDFMYDYGGGMRFFGGEKAGLRIDARQFHYSARARGTQDYIEITVGLTFVLGGA